MNLTVRQLKTAFERLTEEELDRKMVVDTGIFEVHDYRNGKAVFSLFVDKEEVHLGIIHQSKDNQPIIRRWPKLKGTPK